MERTQAGIVLAGFFQCGARINNVHNIHAGQQVIDETLWDHSRHIYLVTSHKLQGKSRTSQDDNKGLHDFFARMINFQVICPYRRP